MKRHISVDLELSGQHPELHSILSLGACVVEDTSLTFYKELKPLSHVHNHTSVQIAAQGLICLSAALPKNPYYNPDHIFFNSTLVLNLLYKKGVSPRQAIVDFETWIYAVSAPHDPVFVAKPVNIDHRFLQRYFTKFLMRDTPFGDRLLDLVSEYRKVTHDPFSRMHSLGLPDLRTYQHNALEDAIHQANQFSAIEKLRLKMEN